MDPDKRARAQAEATQWIETVIPDEVGGSRPMIPHRPAETRELAHWVLGRVQYDDMTERTIDVIWALSAEFGHTLSEVQIRDLLRTLSAPTVKSAILRGAIQDAAQARAQVELDEEAQSDAWRHAEGTLDKRIDERIEEATILRPCRYCRGRGVEPDPGEPHDTEPQHDVDWYGLQGFVRLGWCSTCNAEARSDDGVHRFVDVKEAPSRPGVHVGPAVDSWPSDERRVLWLDNTRHEWNIANIAGCSLRNLGDIPESCNLFRHVPGSPDVQVDDYELVVLYEDENRNRFSSQSRESVGGQGETDDERQKNPGAITVSADCPRCGESVEVVKFESGGTDVFSVNPSGEAQREPEDGLLQLAVSRVTESVERMARAVVSEGKGALDDATEELYRDLLDLVQHARDGGRRR